MPSGMDDLGPEPSALSDAICPGIRSRVPDTEAAVALVVFLRGVNIGGHRTFRPTRLAERLAHLGTVNIGAAGTFVVRKPVGVEALREEVARLLPFETRIVICQDREVARLVSRDPFAGHPERPDIVRFACILSRIPRPPLQLPLTVPPGDEWLVNVLERDGRFLLGLYRRRMETIRTLGRLDRLIGVPFTSRSWSTLVAVARVLDAGAA